VGANSTQAQGVALFLIGFTLVAAGIGRGFSILLIAGGAILIAGSVVLFQKCKPWEHEDKLGGRDGVRRISALCGRVCA
jgi:membrane-bound ClpP family serine protease